MGKLHIGKDQYAGENGRFLREYTDKQIGKHKKAYPIDHPDYSITLNKLHEEVTGEFAKSFDVEQHFAGRGNRHDAKDIDCELFVHGLGVETSVAEAIDNHTLRLDGLDDKVAEHKADTANPHAVTKAQVGLGNVDNTSDANKPISTAMQTALDTKADKETKNGGFVGGRGAHSQYGGASIGEDARSANGGSVGGFAQTQEGGSVGASALSMNGGAVGQTAQTSGGGAVGENAKTSDGFAGGKNALAESAQEPYGAIDAIQLGTGTNTAAKTLQIYDKQLLDAGGHIPSGRMPQLETKADKYTENSGFEGGWGAKAEQGGAAGMDAVTANGGAVGAGAIAGSGFAGGYNAQAIQAGTGTGLGPGIPIDAIQLGSGENNAAKTLQVYGYRLMERDGTIPLARLPLDGAHQFVTGADKLAWDGKLSPDDLVAGSGVSITQSAGDFVIAAAGSKTAVTVGTATEGHTVDMCDFLCDGTDDQEEINAALNLAETGPLHRVQLLPGTYQISLPVRPGKNGHVTLSGSGWTTVLRRADSLPSQSSIIYAESLKFPIVIEDFAVDGRRAELGAYVKGITINTKTDILEDIIVRRCAVYQCYDAIYLSGSYNVNDFIKTTKSHYIVENNLIYQNRAGVNGGWRVTGNTFRDHEELAVTNQIGVFAGNDISGAQHGVTLPMVCASVYGNRIANCTDIGIRILPAGKHCLVSGNYLQNNKIGVSLDSQGVVVSGNSILCGTGTADGYTAAHKTIEIKSTATGNLIMGNHCHGKDITVAGSGNSVTDNLF